MNADRPFLTGVAKTAPRCLKRWKSPQPNPITASGPSRFRYSLNACSSVSVEGAQEIVLGSDYVRGPKFRLYELGYLDDHDVGYYLAMANFSDIAAMGGAPPPRRGRVGTVRRCLVARHLTTWALLTVLSTPDRAQSTARTAWSLIINGRLRLRYLLLRRNIYSRTRHVSVTSA